MIGVQEDPSPVIKTRRRRCLCCQKLFGHDPRVRRRQKYCSEPECRAASKRSSQRRWLRKPENHEYFCGEQHVDRVQAWRAQNPGYWRKPVLNGEPLQEMIRAQATDRMGQCGSLRGSALQDVMCRRGMEGKNRRRSPSKKDASPM